MEQTQEVNFIVNAFHEGGFVMYIIAGIFLASLFIVLDRLLAFSRLIISKKEFTDFIYGMILRGDLRQAIAYCDAKQAPLSLTVKAGLVQAMNKRPDEEIQVAMDAAYMREGHKLEGATNYLAVTGNVAVLAGLMGTIFGMIGSFKAVANADPATKSSLLSAGISHALNCTAFGLMVAMLSMVAFAYFQSRIQRAENEIVETSMTLLNLIASNRDKLKD